VIISAVANTTGDTIAIAILLAIVSNITNAIADTGIAANEITDIRDIITADMLSDTITTAVANIIIDTISAAAAVDADATADVTADAMTDDIANDTVEF
jgi:hypothetical protein